MNDIEKQPILW